MKADTYRRTNGDVRVVLHLGGSGHSLSADEAFECARLLLGAIPQEKTAEDWEKLGIWYLFAGRDPALLVGYKTGTLAEAQIEAVDLAKKHGSVIWAMKVQDVTGILAYPPCWVCESGVHVERPGRPAERSNKAVVKFTQTDEDVPLGEVPAVSREELARLAEEGRCILDDQW